MRTRLTAREVTEYLQEIIIQSLANRVNASYWLLDVPYYPNVGDTLIWQGELDFLQKIHCRCKGMYSYSSMRLPRIPEGELILFQGGGNLGDIWPLPHQYRKRIMTSNPTCRYLIFPQTVCWEKEENLRQDADFFSQFDCTICARDQSSYDILKANFKNEILLVPDMAFCIDMTKWMKRPFSTGRPLLVKRNDKEFCASTVMENVMQLNDIDISDWPTFSENTPASVWQQKLYRCACTHSRKLGWLYDLYMRWFYRPAMIRSGVEFLSSHTDIYTTRLHACILSILLGKKNITLFDNSYGKNSGFYDTWLKDCESVHLVTG